MPGQDFPRDYIGRPQIIPRGQGPDAKKISYTRATTFVNALEDTYGVEKWKMRLTAIGIAQREDLQFGVIAAAEDENKKELDSLAERALEQAGANSSSTKGTAFHSLTEKVDAGEEPKFVPEAYRPDLDAFTAATRGFRTVAMEKRLVHDELQVAGTTDRIYDIDGVLYIGDTKSGKSIDLGIGKIVQQLALYSRCEGYDLETGERTAIDVSQDWGLIVHSPLGTGTCEVWWVDLTWGWYGVQLSHSVREYRKRKFKDIARSISTEGAAA